MLVTAKLRILSELKKFQKRIKKVFKTLLKHHLRKMRHVGAIPRALVKTNNEGTPRTALYPKAVPHEMVTEQNSNGNMKGIDELRRVCLFGLAGFGSLCLLLILIDQWDANPLNNLMRSMFGVKCFTTNTTVLEDVDQLNKIQQMIDVVRNKIRDEMSGYPYPNGRYNISGTKLEDFMIAENGKPVRSIVLTSWRNGGTFFGEILASHPGNYYSFEPLIQIGHIVRIRGPPLAARALKHIRALLNCEFAGRDEYVKYLRDHPWLRGITPNLWEPCGGQNDTCYDHRYLSGICKLYPFQSMKIVGLRLSVAQELLADEELSVRMVLLVRDPRGTMQSRKGHAWCPGSPDCSEPVLHCADLVSDYKIAAELMKKYPSTFRVIRYEDLSTDPFEQAEELSEFYGRNFHPKVINYLETHTSAQFDYVYGTYRDSKSTPFHWKTELTFEEVDEIQRSCQTAMKYWGYVPAINATHLREFSPVTDYDMTSL